MFLFTKSETKGKKNMGKCRHRVSLSPWKKNLAAQKRKFDARWADVSMPLTVLSTLTKTNRINKLRDGAFEINFLSLWENKIHITAWRARKQTSILSDTNILCLIEIYIHFFLRRRRVDGNAIENGARHHCFALSSPHSTRIMHDGRCLCSPYLEKTR